MISKFAQFSGHLCTGFCAQACSKLVYKESNKREIIPNYPINEKLFSNNSKREIILTTH